MKVAIITDSSAYLPSELQAQPNIYIVNLNVHFPDGVDMVDSAVDQADFYQKLVKSEPLPTTSQPPAGAYIEVIEKIINEGYDVVFGVFMSSGISGTFQTATMILEDYEDQLPIYLVDSKGASVVEEALVRHIMDRVALGIDFDQVYQEALWLVEQSEIYLTVENLDNLSKGGRLSSGSALIGNLLKIKPLMVFDDAGQIVLFEKLRTDKKVIQRWCELIAERLEQYPVGIEIWLAHGDIEPTIQSIKKCIQSEYPNIPIQIRPLGSVISTHLGHGGRGIALIPKIENR